MTMPGSTTDASACREDNSNVDTDRMIGLATGLIREFKIIYLVPHSPQSLEDSSAFGWYTSGILRAAWALARAASLPADVREAFASPQSQLLFRLNRSIWPTVTLIQTSALEIIPNFNTPFIVFLSAEAEAANTADQFRATLSLPTLHASMVAGPNRIGLAALTFDEVCRYVRVVVDALAGVPESASLAKAIRRVMCEAPQRKARKHPLREGHHNVTDPNEIALQAFGWKLTPSQPLFRDFPKFNSPQLYINRIIQSADAVSAFREELLTDAHPAIRDNRYILAVTAVYWGQYQNISERVARLTEKHRHTAKRTLRQIVYPTTYYDQVLNGEIEIEATKMYLALQAERAGDLKAFTASLSCMAAASLTPVLRLEPKVAHVRKEVNLLCHSVRASSGPHHKWKASRLGRALGEKMRSLIAPEFLERIDAPEIDNHVEGMKLVCDAPLELLHTGGIALSLRFDTSRISPLPGNLSHAICSMPPIFLPLSSFSEVLVIRSFATTDPVRPTFQKAVDVVSKDMPDSQLSYRFVDVSVDEDIVAALSSFNGAIVVFDCHGTIDRQTGGGTLLIGGRAIDIWSLREKISRLPPIVMFSACDTQPLDGSHSSVATAAFSLGARAVLATFLPIDARNAAVFNARMLIRLAAYLPIAARTRPVMTWREVTSGLLRMTYVIEAMQELRRFAGYELPLKTRTKIQFITTDAISNRYAGWYRVFVESLANELKISPEAIRNDLTRWCSFMDVHKYIQLGNPENVIITSQPLIVEKFL